MDSAVLLDLLGNENRRRILRLLAHKPCYVTEISEYLGVSPKAVIDHLRRLEEAGLVESRTDDQRRKYFHIAQNLRLEVSVSPYRFGAKSAYPASQSLDMRGCCRYLSVDLPEGEGGGDRAAADIARENGRARENGERRSDKSGERTTREDRPESADRRTREDGSDDPATGDREHGAGERGAVVRDGDREADGVASLAREYAYLEEVESELSLAQRWIHGRVTDVLDSLTDQIGAEADSRFHAEVLAALARDARSARDVARELNASPERVETALDRLSERGLVTHDGSDWRIV
ncbi:metalloregulator ArsR/SmtB family transcription factor [Halobellus sp. GM3]|uniref:metalloregulator ArsR/SmtB family transcription factor n=1 Tax=Halobellus sp. GM3 TaxID=3458410 RepID=UPI00403DAA68